MKLRLADIAQHAAVSEPTVGRVPHGRPAGAALRSLAGGLGGRGALRDTPGGPYSIDENDSKRFVGGAARAERAAEVAAKNWREYVSPDNDEIQLIRLRLGDKTMVEISGRDYAEGRVAARLLE